MRKLWIAGAMLLLAACGGPGGGGAGADNKEIVIGVLADLTGATADVGTPYNEGMLAYVDKLNAGGGIDGHKIKALSENYAYKVEVLTDPSQSPFNFVVAPTYFDQMRVALDQIAGQDPTAQVAVFHHDSPFGTAPLADGQMWIAQRGYQLGFRTYPMKAGSTDFVGLLQQAQSQDAKYVVMQNVTSPAAVVARDIAAQKLGMRIVCLNWCADELFVKTAGAAAEGHWMIQPFAPPTANKPGHQEVRDYAKSKGVDLDAKGLHYVQGWYTMHVMAKGIEKVLSDRKELTGPELRKALESMSAVDTGGVIGPVKFSAESHRGATASGVYRVEGGKLIETAAGVTPKA